MCVSIVLSVCVCVCVGLVVSAGVRVCKGVVLCACVRVSVCFLVTLQHEDGTICGLL